MRDPDLADAATVASTASELTAAVAAAAVASFDALLADRDVSEIGSLEGGSVDVLRRGRRQRLDVIFEGPLFALLREAGAETAVLTVRLPQGHELVAGPLADGRIALRVIKAATFDTTLETLVEEGVLPAGIDVELRATVLEGAGVLVIGPARAARRRVVTGIVRALSDRLAWFGVSDALSSLMPVPLARGTGLLDKARAAAALGADVLCALDITPREAIELARAELAVPFVVAIAVPSMDALSAAFRAANVPVEALGSTTAVVGHGPDGEARLVELHGASRGSAEAPASRVAPATMVSRGLPSAASVMSPAAVPSAPLEISGLRRRPAFSERSSERSDEATQSGMDDELPPLATLPDGWASDHADDDPGWELGDATFAAAPPEPGSFDAALASTRSKPAVSRPPLPQARLPQARLPHERLPGGDPFGGLTFEPPPGGPPGDDDEGSL